jgi:lipid-binding SYLF domain-containing protein
MRIAKFAPFVMFLIAGLAFSSAAARSAAAASAVEIDAEVDAALIRFYEQVPAARDLAGRAKGILIFPSVVKAGFGVGGSTAKARSGSAAPRSDTTTPRPPRSASRSVCSRGPRC